MYILGLTILLVSNFQQANFEFCESIPGFISILLCAFVSFYEKICPDNCGSAEDDDGDDDNNATSLLLSESNVIIQPEERLFDMVVSRVIDTPSNASLQYDFRRFNQI